MDAEITMPPSFNQYHNYQQQSQPSQHQEMSQPPPSPPPQQPPLQMSYQPQDQEIPYIKPANLNIPPLLDNSPINSPNETLTGNYYDTGDVRTTSEAEYQQAFVEPNQSVSETFRGLSLRYQTFLDKISPHWKARWTFSLVTVTLFLARVIVSQGWYVICYALAIYYLNLLIGFISPKVDPSLYSGRDDEGSSDLGPMLPTHANDEFKPFIRRLPEFKFWISSTKATILALFLTLFEIFDVPVFWPILLIYFIILFACTMRQQIKHMVRYSYVPWDSGKKRYTARRDSPANLYPTTV